MTKKKTNKKTTHSPVKKGKEKKSIPFIFPNYNLVTDRTITKVIYSKPIVNKRKIKNEKANEGEKSKNEKENEGEKSKDEKKEEDKVRLIKLEEAGNLELDKIAYIIMKDGSVVIIKNQGESLVQDLLKIKNPIGQMSQNEKIQVITYPQKNPSQKKYEKIDILNSSQKPSSTEENKYKLRNINLN